MFSVRFTVDEVALLQALADRSGALITETIRTAALQAAAPPAAVPARATRPALMPWWREAVDRVDTRADRGPCDHPEKKAYDPTDLHELRVVERRRRPGAVLYPCRCGWSHLGATPATVAPSPPMPEVPAVWATQRRTVALINGSGDVIAVGRVVSHEHAPTVQVETDRRRVTWRADMIRALDERADTA